MTDKSPHEHLSDEMRIGNPSPIEVVIMTLGLIILLYSSVLINPFNLSYQWLSLYVFLAAPYLILWGLIRRALHKFNAID
jgi:hypothetical protein